jgi:hypothetical protein
MTEEKLVIFNGGEWMLKYNKAETISAMKNMAFHHRRKGGLKSWTEERTVVRTDSHTKEEYDFLLVERFQTEVPGTNMGKYQLHLEGKRISWSDINKIPIGLLRWQAYQAGLREKHFYKPTRAW